MEPALSDSLTRSTKSWIMLIGPGDPLCQLTFHVHRHEIRQLLLSGGGQEFSRCSSRYNCYHVFFSRGHRVSRETSILISFPCLTFIFFFERISKNIWERSIFHRREFLSAMIVVIVVKKKLVSFLLQLGSYKPWKLNSILVIFMVIKNSNSLWGKKSPNF